MNHVQAGIYCPTGLRNMSRYSAPLNIRRRIPRLKTSSSEVNVERLNSEYNVDMDVDKTVNVKEFCCKKSIVDTNIVKQIQHRNQRNVLMKWMDEKIKVTGSKEGVSREKEHREEQILDKCRDTIEDNFTMVIPFLEKTDRKFVNWTEKNLNHEGSLEDLSCTSGPDDVLLQLETPITIPIPHRRYKFKRESQPVVQCFVDATTHNCCSLSSIKEDDVIMPTSPSRRKRKDMMRKFHSTPAISISEIGDTIQFGTAGLGDNCSICDNIRSLTHSQTLGAVSDCDDTSSVSSPSEVDSKAQSFDKLDIVGESYEARFPWQRDISTQCDIDFSGYGRSGSVCGKHKSYYALVSYSDTKDVDSQCLVHRHLSSCNSRRRKGAIKNTRTHSMGSINVNMFDQENYPFHKHCNNEQMYWQTRPRNASDPCPLDQPTRKLLPLLVDPGSLPDLESIMEIPHNEIHDNYHNSLDSDRYSVKLTSKKNLRRLERSRNGSIESPTSPSENDTSVMLNFPSTSGDKKFDILPSPRVSPEMWKSMPDMVVNSGHDLENSAFTDCLHSQSISLPQRRSPRFLSVPEMPTRRLSSLGIHSGSDDSDQDISPPVARRGRRAAIVDTKNFGDVSPTQLSPDVSPSNSCDEGEAGSNIAERLRRRRSSHDVSMNVYPGDLLVQEQHKKLIKRNTISDFYAGRTVNGSTNNLNEESKKHKQPFSLLKLMKARSKESLHLSDVLKELKPSEFKDNHLAAYKNVHWTDLIASSDKQTSHSDTLNISEGERKRRESVWELFKSECVFLIDHLMVLKHCFLEPLKKVQVEGFLMFTEPSEIFSNLDELCYVSYTFCKDFIYALVKDMSSNDFGSTKVLIKAFQRFSKHSKDGSVYHVYCLNYTNALTYLEKLRKNDDFCEFEKWCEQDPRCNRLQLADLLIGPMQHCTKLPLLLQNIQKYTEDGTEKIQIKESLKRVEASLHHLEEKMKWLKNFERVQEVQRHLVWPSITELDPRVFIPDYLKLKLLRQPCERLLACPSRQLVYEGAISMTESVKSSDGYMFLFDDMLLITKVKKSAKKKHAYADPAVQPDNQLYTVHRQPIALDRIGIHDVTQSEAAANGLKFAFVIVQISRFQQIIDVFTLQANSEQLKTTWMSHIIDAKNNHLSQGQSRCDSVKRNENAMSQNNGNNYEGRRGKLPSTDTVFL